MLVALSFLTTLVNLSGLLDDGVGATAGDESCRSTESDGGYGFNEEQRAGAVGATYAASAQQRHSRGGDKRAE